MNLPGNPLASIIAAAKAKLPAETGATASAATRAARGDVRVVLADVSASMADRAGRRIKWDILNDALRNLPHVPIVAFNSYPSDVAPGAHLPPPAGSTALHLALDYVSRRDPGHLIIISDGHPDDPVAALAEADRINAQIDVIYCGPDSDADGMRFMQRLARRGGQVHRRSFWREPERISQTVQMLALPSK